MLFILFILILELGKEAESCNERLFRGAGHKKCCKPFIPPSPSLSLRAHQDYLGKGAVTVLPKPWEVLCDRR